MMDIKMVLLQLLINFFDKKTSDGLVKNGNMSKKICIKYV